jgi:hypothetical protein
VRTSRTFLCRNGQYFERCMTATDTHAQLGNRFIEMSEQCHKQINADAVGWWKDEVRV